MNILTAILFHRAEDYEDLTSVVEFKRDYLTEEEKQHLKRFAREMTNNYIEETPVPPWAVGGPFRYTNVLHIRKRPVHDSSEPQWCAKKNTWYCYEHAHTLEELTKRFIDEDTGRYSL